MENDPQACFRHYYSSKHSISRSRLHSLSAMCVWDRSTIVKTKSFDGEEKINMLFLRLTPSRSMK